MSRLKDFAKSVPALPLVYRALRESTLYHKFLDTYEHFQLKHKTTEEVFTDIFKNNSWGGDDSISGIGSSVDQTKVIIKEFSTLFDEFNISTLLDIPCGDFHWMKNVDLTNVDYIGADIVQELIENNIEQYGTDGLCFQVKDLIKDNIPTLDLIFCRDCLVHLSYEKIFLALDNICKSESKYLLTTTFTDRESNNDIVTGEWRALNLEAAPFFLPKPIKLINEECTESDGIYSDKALGLWEISDIRKKLDKVH